jgi:hypothetical protein
MKWWLDMQRVSALIFWVVLMASARAEDLAVPEWFQTDQEIPSQIFETWRCLSTREAALYLGSDWTVCGGELRDEEGALIADSLLRISYDGGIRQYSAALRTDTKGRFIIYAPYAGTPLNLDRVRFHAAQGYPFSQLSMSFAGESGGWHECEVHQFNVSEERSFITLTSRRDGNYEEDAFRKFVAEKGGQWEKRDTPTWRTPLRSREGASGRGILNEYRVQLVLPEGKPIPDAVVHYTAYDGFEGNQQAVLTDANGTCLLTEELLANREEVYYNRIRRALTVDVPGYCFGPLHHELNTTVVNRITVQPGGVVSGTLKDWNGKAYRQRVSVEYRDHFHAGFELDVFPSPDGAFTIRRIMPGAAFRVRVSANSHQSTPSAGIYSEEFVLKPGESRENVSLTVPQAAAIRGIVVDAEGRPVTSIYSLMFHSEHRGWGQGGRPDGRFGTYGVSPGPLQIKVKAKGFEDHTSEKILLEAGELRFVRIVMKKNTEQAAESDAVPASAHADG